MNTPDEARNPDGASLPDASTGTSEAPPPTRRRTRGAAQAPSADAAPPRNFWIGVVPREHVDLAVAGGYAQLNHGKAGPLERMRAGDGFAFYSPRLAQTSREPLQAFTAIGRVRNATIQRVQVAADFAPFRIAIDYFAASPAPVKPLLESLTFIRSKSHWGAAFRFGHVRVPAEDFARIAAAMGRDFAVDFA
jgi:hypothetical protein